MTDPTLTKLASDQQSFERLFNLLSSDSSIGEDVWDILMLLPVNEQYLRRFRSPEDITIQNWAALFDTRSLYKLLYSLQIVDTIMLMKDGREPTPKKLSFDVITVDIY